jgi:prepilin-type N-terminal cleavage/methylation domain-containing protein
MRISIRQSRRAAQSAAQATGSRKGFVLVEVIVAMVLLAVAVSSLAALVWSVSHSGLKTTGDAYRNGVLMQEVNRSKGIPYDSFHQTYSVTMTLTYPHTRTLPQRADGERDEHQVVLAPANPPQPGSQPFGQGAIKVLCTDCPELNN